MAERKGLFSRLFGKKDKGAADDQPPLETPDVEQAPLEESIAPASELPVEAPAPIIPPPTSVDDLPQAEPLPPVDEPAPAAPIIPDVPAPPPPEPVDLIEEVEPEPQEVVAPSTEPEPEPKPKKKKGLFGRLAEGLSRTSQKLTGGIGAIFTKRKLDDDTLEELEDLLISADLGIPATTRIITALAKDKFDKEVTDTEIRDVLSSEIIRTLQPLESHLTIDPAHKPYVILMTGVNGAGKTTTIGKLAKKLNTEGYSTLLAAGDTFRAAAIEQLQVWGDRTGSRVVTKPHGADAAGLAFDAIKEAQEHQIDVVLIDTAGRLQNRRELMDELAKIVRVIKKLDETAPHEALLVLDATVGQNALSQAEVFTEVAGISGLVMTKLDGTAKGGVLVALADKFGLPIKFIGVGEDVDDLQQFTAEDFALALTASEETS